MVNKIQPIQEILQRIDHQDQVYQQNLTKQIRELKNGIDETIASYEGESDPNSKIKSALEILERGVLGERMCQYSFEELTKKDQGCSKEEFCKNFRYYMDIGQRE